MCGPAGGAGLLSELDRIDAQHGISPGGVQAGRGQVPDAEVRRVAHPPCVLAGLAHRLAGEVDAHQPGPAAGGDLQAVPPAAAGQIQQDAAGRQAQGPGGLGDPFPAQQAGGQQACGRPR